MQRVASRLQVLDREQSLGFGEEGTLVWMNRYSDPMTLIRAADGSFV